MPLLTRKTLVAAKAEGTAGTAVSLADADAMLAYNPKFNVEIPMSERENTTGFGLLQSIPEGRKCTASFSTDLTAHGSTYIAPVITRVLLAACGFTSSDNAVWTPATTATPVSLAVMVDGLQQKMSGGCGTFEIDLSTGKAGKINWTFTGKYVADANATQLVQSDSILLPPRFAASTVTVGGYTPLVNMLKLTAGNEVVMREDATDATGYISAYIVDRKPHIELDPEVATLSTKDWLATLVAGSTAAVALSLPHAHGSIDIAAAAAQVIEANPSERNKMMTRSVKLLLTGIPPFTITYTAGA